MAGGGRSPSHPAREGGQDKNAHCSPAAKSQLSRQSSDTLDHHEPSHVWSRILSWSDLPAIVSMRAASSEWKQCAEIDLIPRAVRRILGAATVNLKRVAMPEATWLEFLRAATSFRLCPGDLTHGAAPAERQRVLNCVQAIDHARHTFDRLGRDFQQEHLIKDPYANVTVLCDLWVPAHIVRDKDLIWEIHVGNNTNGNVLVGIMSDRDICCDELREQLAPLEAPLLRQHHQSALKQSESAGHTLMPRADSSILRAVASQGPRKRARLHRDDPAHTHPYCEETFSKPLTFSMCANTGELYYVGRQITATARGVDDSRSRILGSSAALDSRKDGRSPLSIFVHMHSRDQECRFAFFVQRGGNLEPSQAVFPHFSTPMSSTERFSFGVEFCTQAHDRADWVEMRGPRASLPQKSTTKVQPLSASCLYS